MASTLALLFSLLAFSAAAPNQGTRPDVTFMNETIVYASAGENMSLSCSTADQADSIAWYFNNVPVTRGTDMRGELWFTPLRETDNGWYTCAAANRYGRVERDFLLVVVAALTKKVTFKEGVMYTVPVGSRVELPCHYTGTPQPTIQWFKGGSLISVNDSRYTIDNLTQSLVFYGSGGPESLDFSCLVSSRFDNQSNDVTVQFYQPGPPGISFPLNDRSGPIMTSGESEMLTCTNLSSLAGTNYTVEWQNNFTTIQGVTENTLVVDTSGYYCCVLNGPNLQKSYFCITVVIGNSSSLPDLNVYPTNVSLPSGRGRTVNLLCSGSTPSGYAPPTIDWTNAEGDPLTPAEGVELSPASSGWRYLSNHSDVACMADVCSTVYRCSGQGNLFGSVQSSPLSVDSVAVCSGTNELRGGNAEMVNDLSHWMVVGNASIQTVNNEKVFVLPYDINSTDISINQTVYLDPDVKSVHISGRIRQEENGVAQIQVLLDNTNITSKCPRLGNPYPSLRSWQWISCSLVLPSNGNNLTVMMSSSAAGTAYFDDLCVTFTRTETSGGGGLPMMWWYVIIGGGAFVILLLLLVIIVVCCLCCGCCGRRKGNSKMMKKMSMLIKKKHSAVIHELRGTDARYTTEPGAPTNPNESDMYVVAEPQPEDYVDSSSYINPDDYASTDLRKVRIPSVVVDKPNKTSNSVVGSPSASSTAGDPASSNQLNGVYTSLKRGKLDDINVYMTPSINHSSSSLQNLADDDENEEGYVYVEGSTSMSASYLRLMAAGGDEIRRSSSTGRLSPCPRFPPPPPPESDQQIYENSEEVVPRTGISNGAFRRASTSSPLLVPPEEQQIYENSCEVARSTSPMLNGAFRRTSTDGMHATSPLAQSPPISMSAPLPDDNEDDIYENDLPGMNLHS